MQEPALSPGTLRGLLHGPLLVPGPLAPTRRPLGRTGPGLPGWAALLGRRGQVTADAAARAARLPLAASRGPRRPRAGGRPALLCSAPGCCAIARGTAARSPGTGGPRCPLCFGSGACVCAPGRRWGARGPAGSAAVRDGEWRRGLGRGEAIRARGDVLGRDGGWGRAAGRGGRRGWSWGAGPSGLHPPGPAGHCGAGSRAGTATGAPGTPSRPGCRLGARVPPFPCGGLAGGSLQPRAGHLWHVLPPLTSGRRGRVSVRPVRAALAGPWLEVT